MKEFRVFRVRNDNNKITGRIEDLNISALSQGDVVIKAAYSWRKQLKYQEKSIIFCKLTISII